MHSCPASEKWSYREHWSHELRMMCLLKGSFNWSQLNMNWSVTYIWTTHSSIRACTHLTLICTHPGHECLQQFNLSLGVLIKMSDQIVHWEGQRPQFRCLCQRVIKVKDHHICWVMWVLLRYGHSREWMCLFLRAEVIKEEEWGVSQFSDLCCEVLKYRWASVLCSAMSTSGT